METSTKSSMQYKVLSFSISRSSIAMVGLVLKITPDQKEVTVDSLSKRIKAYSSYHTLFGEQRDDDLQRFLMDHLKGHKPEGLGTNEVVIEKKGRNHIYLTKLLCDAGFKVYRIYNPANLYLNSGEKLWKDFPEIAKRFRGNDYPELASRTDEYYKNLPGDTELNENERPIHKNKFPMVLRDIRVAMNNGVEFLKLRFMGREPILYAESKDKKVA